MTSSRGRVDLHLHTHCSDGALAPRDLVAMLAQAGVTTAAITDHDTMDGWVEGKAAADQLGIRLIPGTELSVAHGGEDIHVLAYFVDPDAPEFRALLTGIRDDRHRRLEEMVARLVRLGIPAEVGAVRARAGQGSVGRVHLALELHERGWVGSYADAFLHYIGDGGPAFRPKRTPSLRASLRAIGEAGGVAVLAHPGAYVQGGLIEAMVPLGLRGVEVYHPMHGPEMVKALEEIAERWGLVKTGGSDYHGVREQERPPGSFDLGEEIVDALAAARPGARTRGE